MVKQKKINPNKPRKGKSCKKLKTKVKPVQTKPVKISGGSTQKVSFNLRKNHVQKYYCPDLVTETPDSVDLNSIQEFPEIPLTDLLNNH